jgi:C4-type Zn-finger protein
MYEAKFRCPVCGEEATVKGKVLNPSRLAFEIEAYCPSCRTRYYQRDADLPWWAPLSRVLQEEIVQKNLPEGEAGDRFVRMAADALAETIMQSEATG